MFRGCRPAQTALFVQDHSSPSLWKSIGGQARAQEVNRAVAPYVDVMIGNEEDFTAALGFAIEGVDEHLTVLPLDAFKQMVEWDPPRTHPQGAGDGFGTNVTAAQRGL